MAGLKQISPSIVGQPRVAFRDTGVVRMPDSGFTEAGKMINGAIEGALSLGNMAARYLEEKDDLSYAKAMSEALSDIDMNLNEKVFSQTGFSSENSVKRVDEIYSKAIGYFKGQSQRNLERAQIELNNKRTSDRNRAFSFEQREMKNAGHTANGNAINRFVDAYATTGNGSFIDSAMSILANDYRLVNGGNIHLLNEADELDAMDTSQMSEDEKKVHDVRRKAVRESANAFNSAAQDLVDRMAASRLELLSKSGTVSDLQESRSYLGEMQGKVSDSAYAAMESGLRKREEASEMYLYTNSLMLQLQAELGEDFKYGSYEQESLFRDKYISLLNDRYSDDPSKLESAKRELESKYRDMTKLQDATYVADLAKFDRDNEDKTNSERLNLVESMSDSRLKDALLSAVQKSIMSEQVEMEKALEKSERERQNDVLVMAEQTVALNQFELDIERGYRYFDGPGGTVPLKTNDEIRAYIATLGLSQENKKKAAAIVSGSRIDIPMSIIAEEASWLFTDEKNNRTMTPDEILQVFPYLPDIIRNKRGTAVLKTEKEQRDFVRSTVADVIANTVAPGFKGGINPEKLIKMSAEDITEKWISPESAAALYFMDTGSSALDGKGGYTLAFEKWVNRNGWKFEYDGKNKPKKVMLNAGGK